MSAAGASSDAAWVAANQRRLGGELARIAALLRRPVAAGDAAAFDPAWLDRAAVEAATPMTAPSGLDTVVAVFGLSPFERDLLLLLAGIEMSAEVLAAAAAAQGGAAGVTFGLALGLLPDAHWSAIAPTGPLRCFRLVELADGDSLTASPLRIDERILHQLAGLTVLDERLLSLAHPVGAAPDWLPPSLAVIADRMARLWRGPMPGAETLQVCGQDAPTRRLLLAEVCARLGIPLRALGVGDLPATPPERHALARLWAREARLGAGALLVEHDAADPEPGRQALDFVQHAGGRLALCSPEPLRTSSDVVLIELPPPSAPEARVLWERALGPGVPPMNGALDRVIANFRLTPVAIGSVGGAVREHLVETSALGHRPETILWEACRAHARLRLDDLAQRLPAASRWEDLVLPPDEMETLAQVAAQVRQRARVYETWGFARHGGRGLGVSALFAGVSGTGKTMAAEVLAHALHVDLYRIDLSQVVSKYIGETEKNLRRIFDAAESSGALLLFDEADALFGKRTEVRDSHDRYANIEVSYLLQRMESYRGLAVLTTNAKSALDTAFVRRLRFIVQFPFPDIVHRREIWRRIFPSDTPTTGLDPDKLARLGVAGGNIRNIALNAAFLAADAGGAVTMSHLVKAARSEFAKMEKPLNAADIGGWT